MPKVIITRADALQALERFQHCQERAAAAEHRGFCAGAGSITAERHHTTAQRWDAKATEAYNALHDWLTEL